MKHGLGIFKNHPICAMMTIGFIIDGIVSIVGIIKGVPTGTMLGENGNDD